MAPLCHSRERSVAAWAAIAGCRLAERRRAHAYWRGRCAMMSCDLCTAQLPGARIGSPSAADSRYRLGNSKGGGEERLRSRRTLIRCRISKGTLRFRFVTEKRKRKEKESAVGLTIGAQLQRPSQRIMRFLTAGNWTSPPPSPPPMLPASRRPPAPYSSKERDEEKKMKKNLTTPAAYRHFCCT